MKSEYVVNDKRLPFNFSKLLLLFFVWLGFVQHILQLDNLKLMPKYFTIFRYESLERIFQCVKFTQPPNSCNVSSLLVQIPCTANEASHRVSHSKLTGFTREIHWSFNANYFLISQRVTKTWKSHTIHKSTHRRPFATIINFNSKQRIASLSRRPVLIETRQICSDPTIQS